MARLFLAALTLVDLTFSAAPGPSRSGGLDSPGYKWNAPSKEKLAALRLTGDPERGKESFELCSSCHLSNAGGTADGTFPRLAGQHGSVVIKELADIRSGIRDNVLMYRYAATLTNAQELADLAAYVSRLPATGDIGVGPGVELERGRSLYARDCARCHGPGGEGDAARFFPKLAGQHFKYMLRQELEMRAHQRRNANPEMVEVLRPYTDADLEVVADYLSRQGATR